MKKNVVCIKWGNKFGADYVNSLYKMVEKNLTIPHRFVCFTDEPEGIVEGVEIRPFNKLDDSGLPEKAWKKLGLFTDQLADLKGRALFLDLDVVIMKNIDEFFEVPGEFVIIKDWDFEKDIIGNSSVFRFEVGKYPDVLTDFYELGNSMSKAVNVKVTGTGFLKATVIEDINEDGVAGATITSHCGPGTLGVLYINDGE